MARPRKSGLFTKVEHSSGAGAGYDLVGNILVGLGLVYVARHFWPAIPVKAYGFGVVLGAISGFYQLFKAQSPKAKRLKATENEHGTQSPQ